jgi:transposase
MHIEPREAQDLERLESLARRERSARLRDRYRAVRLALSGQTAVQIAAHLDRSRRWVQQWIYRYRDQGLDGLFDKPRSGQPPKLVRQQEQAFRARLQAGPKVEDGVCSLRGRDIQRILSQEFGACYSLPSVYDLLDRLGYSCLRPRPRHPKNDPVVMQAWRDRTPLLPNRSVKNTRTDR